MTEDDNQIIVPPSFIALFSDARQRLREPAAQVRQRYELCEDLACQLVGHAQTLYHAEAPSESGILRSIHAGLRSPESGFSGPEATWVVLRLAELLEWASPALESEPDAPEGADRA
ncbi:MAG: hypothetical protein EKK45_09305 [Curvibacter sp.]|nr:MAG: hypothetical protein EKK45_09305 [Curvibacter sp.]